jgi:hypothetical protein
MALGGRHLLHTSVYVADFKGSMDEKQPPLFAATQPLRKNQKTKRGKQKKWDIPGAAISIKTDLFQRHIWISHRHALSCTRCLRKTTTPLNRTCFVAMRKCASGSLTLGTSYTR